MTGRCGYHSLRGSINPAVARACSISRFRPDTPAGPERWAASTRKPSNAASLSRAPSAATTSRRAVDHPLAKRLPQTLRRKGIVEGHIRHLCIFKHATLLGISGIDGARQGGDAAVRTEPVRMLQVDHGIPERGFHRALRFQGQDIAGGLLQFLRQRPRIRPGSPGVADVSKHGAGLDTGEPGPCPRAG